MVCAKGKEMKRRHVMTIHVLSGVSGHLGHNARLLVGKEREQGKELAMGLPLDFHLRGKFRLNKYILLSLDPLKINWRRTSLSWSTRGER